jgi:hypothetical protein
VERSRGKDRGQGQGARTGDKDRGQGQGTRTGDKDRGQGQEPGGEEPGAIATRWSQSVNLLESIRNPVGVNSKKTFDNPLESM